MTRLNPTTLLERGIPPLNVALLLMAELRERIAARDIKDAQIRSVLETVSALRGCSGTAKEEKS